MKPYFLTIANIHDPAFTTLLLALNTGLTPHEISLSKREIRHLASLALTHKMLVENQILSLEDTERVQIKRHSSGEPYLSHSPGLQKPLPFISISHSGPWIACVLSDPETPTCIDLEDLIRQRPFEKISAYAFTEAEHQFVLKEGFLGFYRLWTAKEALSKCQGKGLTQVLKTKLDPFLALFLTASPMEIKLEGVAYTLVQGKLPSNVFYTVAQRRG